jgi:hypothetical protein
MTNYQLGKIYKIVCNTTGLTYYGSTCEPTLARRLSGHVAKCKHFKEGKRKTSITSFKILEGGNYTIVLVELFPCESKIKLHQRERYYIENNECVNKVIPTRTTAEYRLANIDNINEYQNEYQRINKTHISEQASEYYLQNKDKIALYQSEYRLKNQDLLSEYHVAYYLENKEKIAEYKASHRLKNKDKLKIINADYYLNNKTKINEQRAEYRANNKDKFRERDALYRLKQKELKSNPPLGEITE